MFKIAKNESQSWDIIYRNDMGEANMATWRTRAQARNQVKMYGGEIRKSAAERLLASYVRVDAGQRARGVVYAGVLIY